MIYNYQKLKINYEVFGEGKPLLLLHGWMGCIQSLAPIYLGLQSNHKIYVIDFPGQGGKSDTQNEPWGVFEYADLVETFIREMHIENTDVIGHSFGGRVIIELASRNEKIFNKIILTDAAGVKPKTDVKKKMKILSYKISRTFLKAVMPKEKYEQKINELRKKYGSSDYGSITSNVVRETFKKVINYDQTNKLSKIKNSTLLVWGENDTDTPLYMAKIMEKKIEDSGLVVIPNAGHFSYLDNQAMYINVAKEFLK